QIRRRVGDQILHCLQIRAKCGDRLAPGFGVGRCVVLRPVAVGELRRNVTRIAAELENIPLADAHVFQKTPRRVRDLGWLLAAKLRRQVGNGLFEVQVSASAAEKIKDVLAQGLILAHWLTLPLTIAPDLLPFVRRRLPLSAALPPYLGAPLTSSLIFSPTERIDSLAFSSSAFTLSLCTVTLMVASSFVELLPNENQPKK